MSATISLVSKMRRQLPLNAQVGYRWLKYKLIKHPLWEHPEFIKYLDWLEKSQWWSRQEFEEYQLNRLKALVRHAYENVPYYRRVFDHRKLKPDDINALTDIQKLPILTKDDVRNHRDDLVARNVDKASLSYRTTSGSTGTPLGVYQDKNFSYIHELGLVFRQRHWAGWDFGDRYMVLRGNAPTEPGMAGKNSLYSYGVRDNALFLSSYEMSEDNMFLYQKKIEKFKPRFVDGDSSSMEILARFMIRNKIKNPSIEAIFLGSQTILPQQRSIIETTFNCPVFARYGMTEKAADAVECEKHQGYHVDMEYGIFELLNQNNEPITQPGLPGRVTGTGFDTFCMPLIRYVIDDIAELAPSNCECQRQSMLISDFKGRLGELIFSKSGYAVPLSPVWASIHGGIITKIREMKFYQDGFGRIKILIILAPGSSQHQLQTELLSEIYTRLDQKEFTVEIEFVEELPRKARGKLGLLEQHLPVALEHLNYFNSDASISKTM